MHQVKAAVGDLLTERDQALLAMCCGATPMPWRRR
jgi:hypothetical protein